jgi:hypothetical protein
MIAGILSGMSILAGMIPGLSTLVSAITSAWFNAKVQITTAKIGGDTAVARELVIAAAKEYASGVDRLKVLAGSKTLLAVVVAFALPYIVFEWKCIVYDIVWMHGTTSTDAIKGQLADWSTVILSGIFGSSSVMAIGHMYFGRKDQ